MRRWLSEAGTGALSVLLALVVWATAEQASNPVGIVRDVPVAIRAIEEGVARATTAGEVVDVTVRAPTQVLQALRVDDFEAYVDLTGLSAGDHSLDVQAVPPQSEVQVLKIEPPSVDIILESVTEALVPVRVEVMDSPAFGYDARTPVVEPETVQVSGPSRLVESVQVAVAEVYLRSARSAVERRISVSLRAEGGAAVLGGTQILWTPRTVTVTVPIDQRPGYRDMPVRVRWEGQPARGYRISEVAVDPSIVTLFGSVAAIEAVPGYVETLPVNIGEADGNVVERLALIVPENVSIFGSQSVVVSVGITAIEESTWVQRSPVIQGLDERLRAELSPEVVEILLAGPLPRLEALRPGEVQVVLDLTGIEPGTHTLEPSLILPEGLRQETLVPETIEVKISWIPTPTPRPTASPSYTPTATDVPSPTASATSSVSATPSVTPKASTTVTPAASNG